VKSGFVTMPRKNASGWKLKTGQKRRNGRKKSVTTGLTGRFEMMKQQDIQSPARQPDFR
jgi:hypothetical protein